LEAGLPQSTVARIEAGHLQPRWETMARLLDATGHSLEATTAGEGIDRSQIQALLRLTPRQRLETATRDAKGLTEFLDAARVVRSPQ
jgi:predicted transcriptional regulator